MPRAEIRNRKYAPGLPIAIVDNDPGWPRRYEAEARGLGAELIPVALRLEHVGSTGVPGLKAKAVVEIQLFVAALEPMEPHRAPLERSGLRPLTRSSF